MGNFLLDKFKQNSRLGQGSQFSGPAEPTSYFEYMRGAVNPNLVGSNVNNAFNQGGVPTDPPMVTYALLTEYSTFDAPILLLTENGNTLVTQ